jgi:hypothetical protein
MKNDKICSTCKTVKATNDFYIHKYQTKKGEKTYYSKMCKECYKNGVTANKRLKWNSKYKQYQSEATKLQKASKRKEWREWCDTLKSAPCKDCGQIWPPIAMDFDHRDPRTKRYPIPVMVSNVMSKEAIIQEIAGCDLVCACCHRIRTLKRGQYKYYPKMKE